MIGSVVDPANAVIVGAPVTLTSVDTGAVRTATTDSNGTFRFVNLLPGTYNVTVKAAGFKTATQAGIVVAAEETHNAGKMVLQIGSVTETTTVTAEAAAVQLASSENSQTVDAANLEDLTLKGRDLFGYVRLVPGVIDTSDQPRRDQPLRLQRHSHQRQHASTAELYGGRHHRHGYRIERFESL